MLAERRDSVATLHHNREGGQHHRPLRNPVLLQHANERAKSLQNRIADAITGFAGSMSFVYIHVAVFAIWMLLLERRPWPTLTLAVSLEAIFLSTFVMISQNRPTRNGRSWPTTSGSSSRPRSGRTRSCSASRTQILELTKAVHAFTVQDGVSSTPPPSAESRSDT